MTVYVELLIVVNIFINYFLLLSTSKFIHAPISKKRLIFTSFISSLFSLIIFLENINYLSIIMIRIIISLFIVYIAFGFITIYTYIKNTIIFFTINFIFAGIMSFLWMFITPNGMYLKNGIVYFNISPFIFVISTTLSYLIIKIIRYVLDKNTFKSEIHDVEIIVEGNSTIIKGFIDTGNNLVDIFSGIPVCVCQFKSIKDVIPLSLHNIFDNFNNNNNINSIISHSWYKRIKIVPYNVVSNNGVIICFKPDKFIIHKGNKMFKFEVLIGISNSSVSDGEYELLINSNLKI